MAVVGVAPGYEPQAGALRDLADSRPVREEQRAIGLADHHRVANPQRPYGHLRLDRRVVLQAITPRAVELRLAGRGDDRERALAHLLRISQR